LRRLWPDWRALVADEAPIARLSDDVFKISWHKLTGTNVRITVNLAERGTHGVTCFPQWIERGPQKIVGCQNEHLDLMRQYREADPTYPTELAGEFATITFPEYCGDSQDAIACTPGNSPPYYAERRN
jgi:phenolic acid decarboxylase